MHLSTEAGLHTVHGCNGRPLCQGARGPCAATQYCGAQGRAIAPDTTIQLHGFSDVYRLNWTPFEEYGDRDESLPSVTDFNDPRMIPMIPVKLCQACPMDDDHWNAKVWPVAFTIWICLACQGMHLQVCGSLPMRCGVAQSGQCAIWSRQPSKACPRLLRMGIRILRMSGEVYKQTCLSSKVS